MSDLTDLTFTRSETGTLGVELELQLVSCRDFDLTRGASDLLGLLPGSTPQGEIKLEVTESMIEISTRPQHGCAGIAADLAALTQLLQQGCAQLNLGLCGGGSHPFHRWPHRRISPGGRFASVAERYGYLAKQFTVFGQHIHVGCGSGDDAIWLVQALQTYVPHFIALSASSPFADGEDTGFASSRLNAINAFPFSGQCPPLAGWEEFRAYCNDLLAQQVISGLKDLYWDVRPKPEFGTVELRVCDTPLDLAQAVRLAALAQVLVLYLLARRPPQDFLRAAHYSRHNRFEAARYGLDGMYVDPQAGRMPLREHLAFVLEEVQPWAREQGCTEELRGLRQQLREESGDAVWLRQQAAASETLNDVVRQGVARLTAGERQAVA